MRITYMLWYLDDDTWRLVAEGPDHDNLIRGISRDIEFVHRNYEYIISAEMYTADGLESPLTLYKKYCVTQMRGF